MKISWKHHTGGWAKYISKKALQGQDQKELFIKTKKYFIKMQNIHHIYYFANRLVNFFIGPLQREKYQIE